MHTNLVITGKSIISIEPKGNDYHGKYLEVEIEKVDYDFLNIIDTATILKNTDNKLLFEAIIENDEDILHDYLVSHGYIFNKN